MAANIFTLMGSIFVDNTEANKSIAKTSEEGEKSGGILAKLGGTALEVGKKFGEFAIGVATAATGAAVAIGDIAMKSAEAGDRVDKMSQKLGLSREGFQEWDYILGQNGASIDSFGVGMKTLQNTMTGLTEDGGKSAEAFAAVGLSFDDIKGKSPEEAMEATIKALQDMPPGAEKTSAALALFGKQGMELMPMLNQTAESTEELRQRAHDLGIVMSDEAVDAGVVFGDTLDDAKAMLGGLANTMGAEILPAMTEGLEAFIGFVTGVEGSEEKLQSAFDNFVGVITEKIPEFVEKGSKIVLGLLEGLTGALPDLVSGVMEVVPTIITTIMEMLPDILEAGIEIIAAVVMGIAEALPELIPAAVDAVLKLVETLIDNVDLLIDAAIAIIIGLTDGIINALPTLIEKAPVIIQKLVTAIIENVPKLLKASLEIVVKLAKGIIENLPELLTAAVKIIDTIVNGAKDLVENIKNVGKDIVRGIWDGITGMATWIGEKVSGFFKGLLGGAEKDIDAHSPSKLFADKIGKNIALGVAEGITDNTESTEEAARLMSESTFEEIKKLVKNFVQAMGTEANPIGKEMIQGIISGIKDKISNLEKAVSDTAGTIISTAKKILEISSPSKVFEKIGQAINEGLSDGVKTSEEKPKSAIQKLMEDIIEKANQIFQISSISKVFSNMGESLIDGLIEGINNRQSRLLNTIQDLMQQAISAANSALEINSPSRVFAKIGNFTGEGFIDGLKAMAGAVDKTVSDTFGGFDVDNINTGFNTNTPALAVAGTAINRDRGTEVSHRPIEVHIHSTNIINNELDIDKVSRKLSEKTKRAIRSKGGRLQ